MTTPEAQIQEHPHSHVVHITVNRKPVTVSSREVTGLQIKEAAIDQEVTIELDFQLSEELGHHRSRIVGDSDAVHVHDGSEFLAVAPDDNS